MVKSLGLGRLEWALVWLLALLLAMHHLAHCLGILGRHDRFGSSHSSTTECHQYRGHDQCLDVHFTVPLCHRLELSMYYIYRDFDICQVQWWAMRDSNSRPWLCKSPALSLRQSPVILVDPRGVEPRPEACKATVLPLSLRALVVRSVPRSIYDRISCSRLGA